MARSPNRSPFGLTVQDFGSVCVRVRVLSDYRSVENEFPLPRERNAIGFVSSAATVFPYALRPRPVRWSERQSILFRSWTRVNYFSFRPNGVNCRAGNRFGQARRLSRRPSPNTEAWSLKTVIRDVFSRGQPNVVDLRRVIGIDEFMYTTWKLSLTKRRQFGF